MEQIKQMLALMDRKAFCAEGDSIRALNDAARSLTLCEGTPLSELLPPDRGAYDEFTEGCLTLALTASAFGDEALHFVRCPGMQFDVL